MIQLTRRVILIFQLLKFQRKRNFVEMCISGHGIWDNNRTLFNPVLNNGFVSSILYFHNLRNFREVQVLQSVPSQTHVTCLFNHVTSVTCPD